MMDLQLSEELQALSAIYCQKGEFQSASHGDHETIIKIHPVGTGIDISYVCYADYPTAAPSISLQMSSATKSAESKLRESAMVLASSRIGSPMILELTNFIMEKVEEMKEKGGEDEKADDGAASGGENRTLLLQIDHMRNRNIYCKNLGKLSAECDVKLLCVSAKNRIFLIVSGGSDDVKAFMRQYRTRNIDVDSSGAPCKERMITVLAEFKNVPLDASAPFEYVQVEGAEEMKLLFNCRKLVGVSSFLDAI